MVDTRWHRLVLAGLLVAIGLAIAGPGAVREAAAQSSRHEIVVMVTDERGRGVEGLWVAASPDEGSGGERQTRLSATGRVRFQLVEGVYRLHIHTDRYGSCTVSGLANPEGRLGAVLKAESGASSRIDISVSTEDRPERARWIRCQFEVPFHAIEGTVLGPGGEPVKGIEVRAFGERGERFGPWLGGATDATGAFRVEVPDGSYAVELYRTFDGNECSLGYAGFNAEHAYTPSPEGRAPVDGADVAGIAVTLPGAVADLCQRIEGIVTDGDGTPIGNTAVGARGSWPLAGVRASGVTNTRGAFTLYGPSGPYRLEIATTAGDACEVFDYPDPPPKRRDPLEVGAAGRSSLRVVVSGEGSDERSTLTCTFPPELVTTTLRPGWNLAGWTEAESDSSAIFAAIPPLEAAYSWDTETGTFRRANRSNPGAPGSLSTLMPGMGLWLYLGGASEFEWTRPVREDGALLSLSEGWNLVSWVGGEGLSPGEAFASLSAELLAAATWDATAGRFLLYHPEAPTEINTLGPLEVGEALWVNVSGGRHWLQRSGVATTIDFVSEVSADTTASVRPLVDEVMEYFAGRFGLFVPDLTVSVGDHGGLCGVFLGHSNTIALSEGCVVAVPHEYSHAVQHYVSAGSGWTPAWITEGVASRWDEQYLASKRGGPYEPLNTVPAVRRTAVPLEGMETYTNISYEAGQLAVHHIVTLAGEDSVLDYYRQLPSYPTWEEAFEGVFGVSVPAFYASFAEYRAEVAPPFPEIAGRVLDHEGNPLVEARLRAEPQDGQQGGWATSEDDGTFAMRIPEGAYLLEVHVPAEEGTRHAGWVSAEGTFTLRLDEAAKIEVASVDLTGLAIRVPELTWRRIEGVVLGPDGQGVEGIFVDAIPTGEVVGLGATTDEHGAFSVAVIPGPFRLGVVGSLGEGRPWLGWYGGEGGFTPRSGDALIVDTEGGDAGGITISLPYDLSQPHRIEGVVLGPDGEPADNVTVDAVPAGVGLGLIATTGKDGAFSIAVLSGSFTLSISGDISGGRTWLGWYDGESGITRRQNERGVVEVGDSDVGGITINLPFDLSQSPRIEGVVLGPEGQPLEGVTVDARPVGEDVGLSATTDEGGAFSIAVLPGSFRLNLSTDSPDGRKEVGVYTSDGGFSPLGTNPATVEVGEEDVTGLTIRLPVDPALAQWRQIEGVVLGPGGRPQQGITVDAYPTGEAPGHSDVTDEEGAFEIAVLAGTFRLDLWASIPGRWSRLGHLGGEAGFEAALDDAGIVQVGDSDETGVTITLPVDLREETWRRISGVVRGPGGETLEGVRVEGRGSVGFSKWSTTTDVEGRFEAVVLATTYEVGFNHGRCPMGWYAGGSTLVEGRAQARSLSTESGDVTSIDVTAGANCSRVQGVVVGPEGGPVEGLVVTGIHRFIGGEPSGHYWSVTTDESGHFDRVVSRGSYRVSVVWEECLLAWQSNRSDMSLLVPVERSLVVGEAAAEGLVFTLKETPAESCRPFEGTAVGVDGEPLASARFSVTLVLNRGRWSHGFAARTGADGSFAITVREGTYRVSSVTEAFRACSVAAKGYSTGTGAPGMEVGSEGVTGLWIYVSGPAPGELKVVQCTFAE